jgi:hypothetical protein
MFYSFSIPLPSLSSYPCLPFSSLFHHLSIPFLSSLLPSPSSPLHSPQVCFIIFYKSAAIETKIKRICDSFSVNRYDLSQLYKPNELDRIQQDNHREMSEVRTGEGSEEEGWGGEEKEEKRRKRREE